MNKHIQSKRESEILGNNNKNIHLKEGYIYGGIRDNYPIMLDQVETDPGAEKEMDGQ